MRGFQADDDDVDGGFVFGIVCPREGLVGEGDAVAQCEDRKPEGGNLVALADGIGGNKGELGAAGADILRAFPKPTGNVIQDAVFFPAVKNHIHIFALFLVARI